MTRQTYTSYINLVVREFIRNINPFFALNYDQCDDGWNVNHVRFEKILTEDINFYNYYVNMENLKVIEEIGVFPPRFILEVEKKPNCTDNLDRKIRTVLFKAENTSPIESVVFKLFVPILNTHIPMPVSYKFSIEDSTPHDIPQVISIPLHRCDKNRPKRKDIMKYTKKISHHWEHIAYLLDVSEHDISSIEADGGYVPNKCTKVFNTWLDKSHCCWCHFIKTLNTV